MNVVYSWSRKLALVLAGGTLALVLARSSSPILNAQDDKGSIPADPAADISPAGEPQTTSTGQNLPPTQATTPDKPAVASDEPATIPASGTDSATPPAPAVPAPAVTDLKLSAATQQIVKLAQSGVGEDVMLAYVGTVQTKFNLGSDQIIFLNDIGVSGNVIKSMIQRDGVLDATWRAAAAAAAPPTNYPATTPYPPDNGTYQPTPMDDNGTANPPDTTDYTDASQAVYDGADDSGYFYNTLAPYGSWIYIAGSGLCWQPTVCLGNHDWRPYCDRGRWIYSDCGWYWQSDYSWGWGPFHYGRWFQDSQRGWVWKAGRTWGPAWVSWRSAGDYCGWAPLPPGAHYVPGVGVQSGPYPIGTRYEFGLRPSSYTFIPIERMTDYTPGRYEVSGTKTAELFEKSKVVNKYTFANNKMIVHSIDPKAVASAAGTEVRHARVLEMASATAGGVQSDRLTKRGEGLVIYRPQLPKPTASRPAGPTGVPKIYTPPQRIPTGIRSSQNQFISKPASVASTASQSRPARLPNLVLSGPQTSQARNEVYPANSLVVLAEKNASREQPAYNGPLPNMKLEPPPPQKESPFVYQSEPRAGAPSIPNSSGSPLPWWMNRQPERPQSYQYGANNSRSPAAGAGEPPSSAAGPFGYSRNPFTESRSGWQSAQPFGNYGQANNRGPSPERPVSQSRNYNLMDQVRQSAQSHPAPSYTRSESPPPPQSHYEPHEPPPPSMPHYSAPAPAPSHSEPAHSSPPAESHSSSGSSSSSHH